MSYEPDGTQRIPPPGSYPVPPPSPPQTPPPSYPPPGQPTQPPVPPAYPPGGPPTRPPAPPGHPGGGPPTGGGGRAGLWLGIGVVVLIAVIAAAILVTRRSDPPASPIASAGTTSTTSRFGPPLTAAGTDTTRRSTTGTAGSGTTVPRSGSGAGRDELERMIEDDHRGTPASGGKLVVGLPSLPSRFNPATAPLDTAGLTTARAFYDPLVAVSLDGEAVPYLAQSFEQSADGTRWTFELRPDVTFHNGTKLTAGTVEKNLAERRQASSPYRYALEPVRDVRAVDDLTLEVSLSRPWRSFPFVLTGAIGMVVEPSTLAAQDSASATSVVGTGPFVFDSLVADSKLTAKRNPSYWRSNLPYLDALELRPLEDPRAAASALQSGDIDVLVAPDAEELSSSSGLTVFGRPLPDAGPRAVVLNAAMPPFDDANARRAVAAAVDPRASSTGSSAELDLALLPATSPFSGPSAAQKQDRGEAKRLVDEYKAAHGSFGFTLETASDVGDIALSQLLQSQLDDVGIEVTITALPDTALLTKLALGDAQAVLTDLDGHVYPGDYRPTLADPPAPKGSVSPNVARLQDQGISDALNALDAASDKAAARAATAQLDRALTEAAPWVFLGHAPAGLASNRGTKGLYDIYLPNDTAGLPSSSPFFTTVYRSR